MSVFARWSSKNRAAAKALAAFTSSRWFYESERFDALVEKLRVSAQDMTAADIRTAMAESDGDLVFGAPRTSLENGVFRMELRGALMKDVPCMFWFFDVAATSMRIAKEQVQAAVDDPSVEAIMIDIDSPGGTADGLAALADMIFEARKVKPVHAYAQDLAASAAVWAGSQATRISIGSTAIYGSIGVYTVIDDVSAAFAEAGITTHVVRFGKNKGRIVEGAKVEQEALDKVQEEIDAFGHLFIQAVARGRGMTEEAVAKLATGEVWIGADALATGLVDAIESEEEALEALTGSKSASKRMPTPISSAAPSAVRGEVTMPKQAIMAKLQAGEKLSAEEIAFLSNHTAEPTPPTPPAAPKSEDIGAELARERAEREKLSKEVADLKAKEKRERYMREASTFKHVHPLTTEQIADQLQLVDDSGNKEAAAQLRQHFSAVDAAMKSSKLFEAFGTKLGADSAAGQIEAKTTEIRSKHPELTEHQARAKALTDNPELAYELRRGGRQEG